MAKCKHGVDHSGFNECDRCWEEIHKAQNTPEAKFNRAWDKLNKAKKKKKQKRNKREQDLRLVRSVRDAEAYEDEHLFDDDFGA